ncbi:hypothetical protein B1219_09850, partial [Pseudomonas ogarae]
RDQRPPRGGLVADLALPVVHPLDLWEQSLLAIAVCQATSILTAPPPSRAGSLPQWDRSTTGRTSSAVRPPREQALPPQALLKLPTAQRLRSAIVVNGAPQINVHREAAL